jgi:hypothetical protein
MKKTLKYYAKIIGIVLLLPGPLLFVFDLLTIFLPYFIYGFLVLSHLYLPKSLPDLPQPFPFCYIPNTFYYLGFVDIIGCLFLAYGLIGKKSKKSDVIWVFIFMIIILLAVLFFTFLGLFADCVRI